MKAKAKRGPLFDVARLGYLGFLGFVGILWEPLRTFRIAFLLCLFFLLPYRKNFRLLLQVLHYALGQTMALARVRGRLPSARSYAQVTSLSLPFEGYWVVESGGVEKENSHSWGVFNQRYAYDFLIRDEDQRTHRTDGRALGDYYCFGKAIIAPADGRVVEAKDGIRDNPELGAIDYSARLFHGNFVVIQHAEGEFSHLAHFKEGSIAVRAGDAVKRGQFIGLCGNSGHSTEPHLHFHVQDRAAFSLAIGLPVKFSDFLVREGEDVLKIASGYLSKGQVATNEK